MRLVRALRPARRTELEVLRDLGERLQYVAQRYAQLLTALDRLDLPELVETVERLNLQVAYVARQLQEIFVLRHERGAPCSDREPA